VGFNILPMSLSHNGDNALCAKEAKNL
jgi:hypothetical protein